jgi:hypothetical protein
LLPWLIESQMEKILDERLSITSDVESIYLNPFSFYFEIVQLSLTDPDQDALLQLGNLQLNFQASRLALLKLQFAEIRIADLEVPITGNVNDPEFNFIPAIRRAITNILTNIVAAPFRLLRNLIGGGGDEGTLEQI